MTIPTRDELIERATPQAHACARGAAVQVALADFALAEIRRAVAEELEALRSHAVPRNWDEGGQEERVRWDDILRDLLAALRQTESSALSKVAAGSRAPGRVENAQEELPDQGSSTAPALSDADVLERAAEILRSRPASGAYAAIVNGQLCDEAAKLRAASAPVPVPKPVDVFERFEQAWGNEFAGKGYGADLMGLARNWFGPLVDRVESRAKSGFAEDVAVLSALRQRAQEASRG